MLDGPGVWRRSWGAFWAAPETVAPAAAAALPAEVALPASNGAARAPAVVRRGIVVVHGVGNQRRADQLNEVVEPLVEFLAEGIGHDNVRVAPPLDADRDGVASTTIFLTRPGESEPFEQWEVREAWWARSFRPSTSGTVLAWALRAALAHFDSTVASLAWRYAFAEPAPRQGIWTRPSARGIFRVLNVFSWLALTVSYSLVYLVGFPLAALLAIVLQLPAGWLPAVAGFQRRLVNLFTGGIGDQQAMTTRPLALSAAARQVVVALKPFLDPEHREAYQTVTVVAHSGGCVVSYDAIAGPTVQRWLRQASAASPGQQPRRLTWITAGSGLNLAWRMRAPAKDKDAAFWARPLGDLVNWIDIYARYDPVPQGAAPDDLVERLTGRRPRDDESLAPADTYAGVPVVNDDWPFTDHGGYWSNFPESMSRIVYAIVHPGFQSQPLGAHLAGDYPTHPIREKLEQCVAEGGLHRRKTISWQRAITMFALVVAALFLFGGELVAHVVLLLGLVPLGLFMTVRVLGAIDDDQPVGANRLALVEGGKALVAVLGMGVLWTLVREWLDLTFSWLPHVLGLPVAGATAGLAVCLAYLLLGRAPDGFKRWVLRVTQTVWTAVLLVIWLAGLYQRLSAPLAPLVISVLALIGGAGAAVLDLLSRVGTAAAAVYAQLVELVPILAVPDWLPVALAIVGLLALALLALGLVGAMVAAAAGCARYKVSLGFLLDGAAIQCGLPLWVVAYPWRLRAASTTVAGALLLGVVLGAGWLARQFLHIAGAAAAAPTARATATAAGRIGPLSAAAAPTLHFGISAPGAVTAFWNLRWIVGIGESVARVVGGTDVLFHDPPLSWVPAGARYGVLGAATLALIYLILSIAWRILASYLAWLRPERDLRPFPPDEDLVTGHCAVERPGRRSLPLYWAYSRELAERHDGAQRRPMVLVLHEIVGMNPNIERLVKGFARAGYVAAAVDLFAGASRWSRVWQTFGGSYGRVSIGRRGELPVIFRNDHMADLRDTIRYFTRQAREAGAGFCFADPDRLAVVGFCMGGAYAMQLALDQEVAPRPAAAAVFYGFLPHLALDGAPAAGDGAAPTVASLPPAAPIIFQAGRMDRLQGLARHRQLAHLLAGANGGGPSGHACFLYPEANHAFCNDQLAGGRLLYRHVAQQALSRTLTFFAAQFPGVPVAQEWVGPPGLR